MRYRFPQLITHLCALHLFLTQQEQLEGSLKWIIKMIFFLFAKKVLIFSFQFLIRIERNETWVKLSMAIGSYSWMQIFVIVTVHIKQRTTEQRAQEINVGFHSLFKNVKN